MNLEELEVYRVTMDIGERVWTIVKSWDYFARDAVGKQFVRAADSIVANISEGFGRFFYKENRQFGYYARGSLYETRTWLTKAHNRHLVNDTDYEALQHVLESVAIRLNYIRSIGTGTAAVREESEEYGEFNDAAQPPMTPSDAAPAANDPYAIPPRTNRREGDR